MEKVLKDDESMADPALSFAFLFRLMLNDTGIRPSAVALHLDRERSLMYKWLSGKSIPPAHHFPDLIALVSKQASETRKLILERDLRAIIGRSSIPPDLRARIASSASLDELLFECLHLSGMLNIGMEDRRDRSLGRLTVAVLGALFAGVFGGLVWNVLNSLLGWPYFMGGAELGLRGIPALVWAILTTVPIPLPLLAQFRTGQRRRMMVPMAAFVIVGSLAAFSFLMLGIRGAVEAAGLGNPLQEVLIAILYSSTLAIPPLLVAALIASRGRLSPRHALAILAPVLGTALTVLFLSLINRPASELFQLRGFAVGFVLKLLMYTSLIWITTFSVDD